MTLYKVAEKLRVIAGKMQKGIDAKARPYVGGLTARQARLRAGMQAQSDELAAQQKVLRALADDIENDTVPDFMLGVKTRRVVEDLLRQRTDERVWGARVNCSFVRECCEFERCEGANGFIDVVAIDELDALHRLAGKGWAAKNVKGYVRKWRAYHKAGLRDLETLYRAKRWCEEVARPSAEQLRQREIEEEDRALIGIKIEGFWPTPKHLVEQMVDEADIQPGMRVLEPSAGKGDIAMAIRAPGAALEVVEIVPRLARILEGRGFNVVGGDFFEFAGGPYDRILMNPPFERQMDIDHVKHAYDLLKPGGKMIAIMGEGSFFRSDKKAVGFREWLDEVGGWGEKLPQGTFNAATRIVRIRR